MQLLIPDDLTTTDAPVAMTESIRMAKTEEVLRRYSDHKTPEEILKLSEEPRLNAEVEAETFLFTAQMEGCAGRALTYQAVRMTEMNLCRYHPSEPGDIEEHLHQLLDQADAGSTNSYRLKKLVTVILPYLKSHGMADQVNRLWQKDTVAKTCCLVDRIGSLFGSPSIDGGSEAPMAVETFELVQGMMNDLCDSGVSVHLYGEKYPAPTPRSNMSDIQAYNYMQSNGDVIILLCPEPAQRVYVERVLGKKAVFHAGEGREAFLEGLSATK